MRPGDSLGKSPAPQTPTPQDRLDPVFRSEPKACRPVAGEAAFPLRARGGAAGRAQPPGSDLSLPRSARAGTGEAAVPQRLQAGRSPPLRRNAIHPSPVRASTELCPPILLLMPGSNQSTAGPGRKPFKRGRLGGQRLCFRMLRNSHSLSTHCELVLCEVLYIH